MKTLIENMSVHEEIMLRHAREGFSTASELASAIFREKGPELELRRPARRGLGPGPVPRGPLRRRPG